MNKAQMAELIDAYADAKVSGNTYLCKQMISQLEEALTNLFAAPEPASMDEPEDDEDQ